MKQFLLSLAVLACVPTLFAQSTGDYRSKLTGTWNVPGNWERYNGAAWVTAVTSPTSTDGVITIRNTHIITNNTAATADQLVIDAGGQLTQSSTLTLNNATGDDLTINGILLFSAGTINGAGNVRVNATMQWNSGSLYNVITIQNGATLNINGGEAILFSTLTNNGTINWNSGYLSFNGGTLINNKFFNALTTYSLYSYGGTGVFTNSATATFTRGTSTGFTDNNITFTNAGTMNFQTGTLRNNNKFTNTGTLNFSGGTWRNDADAYFNAGTTVTGTGTLIEQYDTLRVNTALPLAAGITLQQLGGAITGTGNITSGTAITWNNGNLAVPLTIPNSATLSINGGEAILFSTLTNNGTINWNSGYISFNNGTLVNNKFFNALTTYSLYSYGGTGVFTNSAAATFTRGTSTGFTDNNITFTNAGTMNFQTGTLRNNNKFTNTGILNFSGGTWRNDADAYFNAGTTVTGTGTLIEQYDTLRVNTALPLAAGITLQQLGGAITGTGNITSGTAITWNNGNLAVPLTIPNSATLSINGGEAILYSTLTNNGTINWNSGYISFNGGTLVNNKFFNALTTYSLYSYGGTGVFTNSAAATFTRGTSTGFTDNNITFTNAGTMNFQTGTMRNNNKFTNTGTLNFSGGTWRNDADAYFNAGTTVTGTGTLIEQYDTLRVNTALPLAAGITLQQLGGAITGTGNITSGTAITWNNGNLAVPLTIPNSATLSISGGESILFSTLTNNGTINWNSGFFSFNGGTLLNNKTLNILGNNQFYNYGGTGKITNTITGFVYKSSTGITTVSVPFTNNGRIVGTGTFKFDGSITNKGVFAPGISIGILTTGTGYTNKTLEIEMNSGNIAGIGYDQLVVNGNASLKDTLKILRTGIVPKGDYTVLTATGTLTGTFKQLIAPEGYTIKKSGSDVLIRVPYPNVSINDTFITEGNGGSKQMKFVVRLAFPGAVASSIQYQTVDSTATIANNDYIAASGTLNFGIGQVTDTITVTIPGDTVAEPDELFYVRLSNPVKLVVKDDTGIGTILNNDGAFFANAVNTGSNLVSPKAARPIIIPNLLHRNQLWKVQGINDTKNMLLITDTRGKAVVNITGFTGSMSVASLPAGMYFYMLMTKDINNKTAVYKGKLLITD